MQISQNYKPSLTLFIIIYQKIQDYAFYKDHEEFFDEFLHLIGATICRVNDIIEDDLYLLHNIINLENVQISLVFKIIHSMVLKLDTFAQICKEYTTHRNNILVYIESLLQN